MNEEVEKTIRSIKNVVVYYWTLDKLNQPCYQNQTRKHLNNRINEPSLLRPRLSSLPAGGFAG